MQSVYLPLALFVFTMAVTPGPNNMILTASGARFGYVKTLPLIIGIILGMSSQLLLSALGLGLLFQTFPIFQTILQIVGTAYILFLAGKIAFGSWTQKDQDSLEKPLGLLNGAVLQYINPKAYLMSITAVSVYSLKGELFIPSMLYMFASFSVIPFFCISLWALFGTLLGKVMNTPAAQKGIRYGLGLLTALSAVFIFH